MKKKSSLTISSVSSALLLLLSSAEMMPARADVNLGTCGGSDCVWLVEDNVVVLTMSLTEQEKAHGKFITLPVPARLDGLPGDFGIGLLDSEGDLDGIAYFNHLGTHLIFKSRARGKPGLEVPHGITLIKEIPEIAGPQLIFSMPVISGKLAQIYAQTVVPEPQTFLLLLIGLGLIASARVRAVHRSAQTVDAR